MPEKLAAKPAAKTATKAAAKPAAKPAAKAATRPAAKPAAKAAAKSASKQSSATNARGGGDGFTDEEREAMRERTRELKAGKGNGEADVLAKIAEMTEADRVMAERIHALVKENAPGLVPRTWYGMPAYAKDGNVLCFFQSAQKFNARYATLGFNDRARLDDGSMWPTAFALTKLTKGDEARIAALLKQAVS